MKQKEKKERKATRELIRKKAWRGAFSKSTVKKFMECNQCKRLKIKIKEQQKENKAIRTILSLATDTCEQQVNELMEQQKKIDFWKEQEKKYYGYDLDNHKKMNDLKKEIDELMESVKNVLEAIDESKRVDALFELKNLYKAILKRTK